MPAPIGRQIDRPIEARRAVRALLKGVPPEIVETVELLTSELATNALQHGAGNVGLVVAVKDSVVRVELRDANPKSDLGARMPATSETSGRGLAIVNALAAEWGIVPSNEGQVVWFEFKI